MIGDTKAHTPTNKNKTTEPPTDDENHQPPRTPVPPQQLKPVDTEPRYRAQCITSVDKEEVITLVDSGCSRSCISETLVRRHPHLYKSEFQPTVNKTVSIDGSKVQTLGIINIPFRINGHHMRMNSRIIQNLIYDFVLGWDFFHKYDAKLHARDGH